MESKKQLLALFCQNFEVRLIIIGQTHPTLGKKLTSKHKRNRSEEAQV